MTERMATPVRSGLKEGRSVTCISSPWQRRPAHFWNMGLKSRGLNTTPGKFRALRASWEARAFSHGAPKSSNGLVVPRPSERFVPSMRHMPG